MAIDKSLKQHYETQAGVKNYLGKQKMVKAPKYWLSKPGHVKAKLAYITDEEEQILIDKNLYGSLRGRPNKGPAGLPSLQGGDFGAGSGSSGGGGGGGGNGSHDRGGWQHHRAATRPTNIVTVTSTKTEPKDEPDGRSIALAKQYVEPVIVPKDEPIIRHHTVDTPIQKLEQKILDQLQEKEKEKFDADWEFEDKKIVKDQLLHIKSIEIDEIDIGALVYEGVYRPEYPEPWATLQKEKGIELPKTFKNVKILWASVREPYNYLQAKKLGCHIITVPPNIIEKIEKFGKSFQKLTTDTVKGFLVDSKKSSFKI